MNVLKELQAWYLSNCNGEWEHSYGIKIETLDNPGWSLRVDLKQTPWAKLDVPRQTVSRSDEDWIDFHVSEARFVGAGGASNLEDLIRAFLELVSSDKSKTLE